MKRSLFLLALACAISPASQTSAQGILDLFGPDRPERPAPRAAPEPARAEKAKKKTDAAKKKQDAAKAKPDAAKPDAAAKPGATGEAPPPPYEPQLVRLSELLGSLAYLRDLCGDKDGDDWRGKMSALIDAEAPSGPRRDKYVAAFNRGFRGYELTYRRCTSNARDVTARYLDETAKISKDVSYRFGTP